VRYFTFYIGIPLIYDLLKNDLLCAGSATKKYKSKLLDKPGKLTILHGSCGAFSLVYGLASFATLLAFSINISWEIWSNMRRLNDG
jgi:hypothetical protein